MLFGEQEILDIRVLVLVSELVLLEVVPCALQGSLECLHTVVNRTEETFKSRVKQADLTVQALDFELQAKDPISLLLVPPIPSIASIPPILAANRAGHDLLYLQKLELTPLGQKHDSLGI